MGVGAASERVYHMGLDRVEGEVGWEEHKVDDRGKSVDGGGGAKGIVEGVEKVRAVWCLWHRWGRWSWTYMGVRSYSTQRYQQRVCIRCGYVQERSV